MKSKLSSFCRGITLFAVMLLITSVTSAQRYVNVNPGTGTLNEAIKADSVNRSANPNTWYVLERGNNSVYVLTSIIENWGPTQLQIMSSGTGKLPVIQGGVQEGGVTVDNLFKAYANLTVRGAHLTGLTTAYSVDQRIMLLEADGVTIRLDSCEVNLAWQSTIRVDNGNSSVFLTNCKISNMNYRFPGNGRVIDNRAVAMDTVFIQNCSIFRNPFDVYRSTGGIGSVKYFYLEHNTINEIARPPVINFTPIDELIIKNNLFVNCAFVGAAPSTTPSTIFSATEGVTSAIIKNNCFYLDTLLIEPVLPDSVSFCALFDSTLQYFVDLHGTAATNIGAPVKFDMAPNDITVDPYLVRIDSIVTWYWTIGGPSQPSQTIFQVDSIQYVNYHYNTDAQAYTCAEGGFPAGDLNWFPDKKAEWETWFTAVDGKTAALPVQFNLEQNYPNPFNPVTTINYNLQKSSPVELTVYNVLGQKIRTLVSSKVQAMGSHSVNWDGRNDNGTQVASGVYLYQLKTGDQVEMKKMVLMK